MLVYLIDSTYAKIVILQVSIPGEEKLVLSDGGEVVASLKKEKLVFTVLVWPFEAGKIFE